MKTAAVLAACLFCVTAAGAARDARFESPAALKRLDPDRSSPHVTCPAGDTSRLDSILRHAMSRIPIPGMATMVVKDGRIVWNRCYGYAILEESIPVTDTTCFTLASISKTFTAAAAMQLWENGYFDLDGDINESLPFAVRHSRFADSTITYRMLLTHTSSIRDNWTILDRYYGLGDPDSSLRTLCENYLVAGRPGYDSALNFYQTWAPGHGWYYCNAAYTLLGFVVESLADSFPVLTRDAIFRPLAMDRTAWFFADLDTMGVACQYWWSGWDWRRYGYQNGSFFPCSFLKSCTRDLGTYLKMWLAYGRHDTLQLLDSTTVEMMMTPYFWAPPFEGYCGFAWYQDHINGDTVWCHGGSWEGVSTYLAVSRRDNSGIVALANGENWLLLRSIVVPALHDFAAPPGIAEQPGPGVEGQRRSTFVRGVLRLRDCHPVSGTETGGCTQPVLLDATGRKVMELAPGENDIRHLAPGVYFVSERSAVGGQRLAVSKVVVTR